MEILCGDLARRRVIEISYKGLVKRTEILHRDLLYRELEQRSSVEISYSAEEISHRHLLHVALRRDLAQQLLQRTCQRDLADDLPQRSSHSELAEPNLVSLPPETTLNEHHVFTTRVALALLAWSH